METGISTGSAELHLIVLWEKARGQQQRIVDDVQQHLTLLQAYEIEWSPERVADNFSRFYGVKLPVQSQKESECGTGAFLLLVVRDDAPKHGYVETTRGHERANLTLFGLKAKYRAWTNGGCKVHTTNSVAETNHDACLLLGKNYDDLSAGVPAVWDGSITPLKRDLTGADGWDSLQQFFYTLNATTEYVVLRGFEHLQETLNSTEHGDIDCMVRHSTDAALLVGGRDLNPHGRPHYLVRIGEQQVFIDIWDIRNHYHDPKWDDNILRTAVLHEGLIRVPCTENYFYMMVHHCLINKRKVAGDYPALLADLFTRTGLADHYDTAAYPSPFDLYLDLLQQFMKERGYRYTRPRDKTVFYSEKLVKAQEITERLQSEFDMHKVRVWHAEKVGNADELFLTAEDSGGTRFFIRSGGGQGLYRRAFRMGKALWDMAPESFIRPCYYREQEGFCCLICEFVEGESLETTLESGTLTDERKNGLIARLRDIHRALAASDVLHRDIRPAHLFISGSEMKLSGFGLAVSKTHFSELPLLKADPLQNYHLGEGYNPEPCVWDDSYSLLRVLERIGRPAGDSSLYDAVHQELEEAIGSARFEHPLKRRILKDTERALHPRQPLFRRIRHFFFCRKTGTDQKRRTYLLGLCIHTRRKK